MITFVILSRRQVDAILARVRGALQESQAVPRHSTSIPQNAGSAIGIPDRCSRVRRRHRLCELICEYEMAA
jgi:hypothetical protein